MRAYEFMKPILREYNRNITLQNKKIRDGIIKMYYKSKYPDGNLPPELYTNHVSELIVDQYMNFIENLEIPGVPNKFYAQWIARSFANNEFKDIYDVRNIIPYLEAYHKYKNKGWFPREGKDILKLTSKQLIDLISNLKIPEDSKNKGKSKVIMDTDKFRIIHLLDKDSAIYYGQGTNPRWCTSYTEKDNRFDDYNNQGPLYVILPKQPTHDNEKYQLHFHKDSQSGVGSYDEYTDERNKVVSPMTLIDRFGPEFEKWFLDSRPFYNDSIMLFKDDNVLENIWTTYSNLIKPQFEQYANEKAQEYIEQQERYEDNEVDYEVVKNIKKEVMDSWLDVSSLSSRRIKAFAAKLFNNDSSLNDIGDIPNMWRDYYEEFIQQYDLKLSYPVYGEYAIVKKDNLQDFRDKFFNVFRVSIEVDGYVIGKFGESKEMNNYYRSLYQK